MAIKTFAGPWRGMDMRDSKDPSTFALGINVDLSGGLVEGRPPLQTYGDAIPEHSRLHLVDRPGIPRYLLCVGAADLTDSAHVEVRVMDADALVGVSDFIDLTATHGEAEFGTDFRCSFVDTFLRPVVDGVPRPATLIVTGHATYVFEPLKNPETVALADVDTDAIQQNAANQRYWDSSPLGPIAVLHQERVFYAGFRWGRQATLDNAIGSDQTAVPEGAIPLTRSRLDLNPSMFVFSDRTDPLGIPDTAIRLVDPTEAITGMHSTGEALLIFTDRAIYALSGSSNETFTLHRLASGVGCVSHSSIVSVSGVVYFMGPDGVYAFGGLGAPEAVKISDGLDPLWAGLRGVSDYLPDALRSRLPAVLGWPWRVQTSDCKLSVGKYNQARQQIWWSLPIAGGVWGVRSMPVTLVYDLRAQGFTLYCCHTSGRTNGTYVSPMVDAVAIGSRWVTSSGLDELQILGKGILDGPDGSSNGRCVPVFWMSQRLFGEGDDWITMSGLRFKLQATGYFPGVSGITVGSPGAEYDAPMYFVDAEEAAHDNVSDQGAAVSDYDQRRTRTARLPLHPNEAGTHFWGTGLWGTAKWAAKDWFTSEVSAGVTSRWFRVGWIDDGWNLSSRTPSVKMQSFGVEVSGQGKGQR